MLNSDRVPSGRGADEGLNVARLMEFSERRLSRAAKSGREFEARAALRVLEHVPLFTHWEQSHAQLMTSVARTPRRAAQRTQLRRVAFLTLHRKAPFEYLRDRRVNGQTRRRLVSNLFGGQDYAQCLVREHAAYLSATCSYLCTEALCADVLLDEPFCDSMTHYQLAYTEYYRAFCDTLLEQIHGRETAMKSLLPYLRHKLKLIREHLVAGSPQTSEFMDLQALYVAGGDTEQLPILSNP